MSVDSSQYLFCMKGFGDEVYSTGFKTLDFICRLIQSTDEQKRNPCLNSNRAKDIIQCHEIVKIACVLK